MEVVCFLCNLLQSSPYKIDSKNNQDIKTPFNKHYDKGERQLNFSPTGKIKKTQKWVVNSNKVSRTQQLHCLAARYNQILKPN